MPYQRLTKKAEALIAAVYLSGTNTRRVKRALFDLFQGAVSKDVVSRAWRKVKTDWQAWCTRSLADEDIVRLILDGTVIKTRLDRKATNISVLAAIGVRRDGQKVLLSLMNMGGESTSAWRQFINDLDARGLKRPEFVIVDGAPGLEAALIALWGNDLPIQRCTVHKHRNLLAHAPKRMHDELAEDYRDMIYAKTVEEIATRRKAFLRKWRLKCKGTIGERFEADAERLQPLPTVPYDACDKQSVRVSSLSLVRYRGNDYSVPTTFGHQEVLVRGYVHEVVIACGAEVIARHARSWEKEDYIYDPLHYLALIEQKTNALDQAAPLADWKLPEAFIILRRLMEARMGKKGKREFVQVLRLLTAMITRRCCIVQILLDRITG